MARAALPSVKQSAVRHEVTAADDRDVAPVVGVADQRAVVAAGDRKIACRLVLVAHTELNLAGALGLPQVAVRRGTAEWHRPGDVDRGAPALHGYSMSAPPGGGRRAGRRAAAARLRRAAGSVCSTAMSVPGRAARSAAAISGASTTSTPCSRSRVTSAWVPSRDVDPDPSGRRAAARSGRWSEWRLPMMTTSDNSTHRAALHR